MQSYSSEESAYMSPDSSSPSSSADSSPSLEPMDLDLNSGWDFDTDTHIHDPYSGSQYARRPPRMYERRGDAAPLEPASSLSTPPVTPPPTQEPAAVTITHDLDDLWGDDEEPAPQQIEFRVVPDAETYETERKLDAWRETISAAVDNNTQTIDISDKGHTFIPDEVSDLASITILQEDHARHLTSARSFGKSESKRKLGSGAQTLGLELNLAANRISVIPPALFALENLTFLSLRGNSLEHLPPQIYRLRRLEILNVANNLLRYLPAEICDLPLKQLNVYPNDKFLPDPSTGNPHTSSSSWSFVNPVEVPTSSVPTLREIILRYLLSPNVSSPTAPHLHMPATPHNSPMRQRGPAKNNISNLAAYIQLPLSPSDLPPSAHILQTHEPGLIARQSFSRVSTAASIASTARGDPEPKGVSHCMSPMHGYNHPDGMGPPYVEHVEQRIVWAHSICGIVVGSSSHGGVPLLWRGCERGCLEFLDGSSSQGEAADMNGTE